MRTSPLTFVRPWTMRMTITSQPDYEIYEYGCHEGNLAMRHATLTRFVAMRPLSTT